VSVSQRRSPPCPTCPALPTISRPRPTTRRGRATWTTTPPAASCANSPNAAPTGATHVLPIPITSVPCLPPPPPHQVASPSHCWLSDVPPAHSFLVPCTRVQSLPLGLPLGTLHTSAIACRQAGCHPPKERPTKHSTNDRAADLAPCLSKFETKSERRRRIAELVKEHSLGGEGGATHILAYINDNEHAVPSLLALRSVIPLPSPASTHYTVRPAEGCLDSFPSTSTKHLACSSNFQDAVPARLVNLCSKSGQQTAIGMLHCCMQLGQQCLTVSQSMSANP